MKFKNDNVSICLKFSEYNHYNTYINYCEQKNSGK